MFSHGLDLPIQGLFHKIDNLSVLSEGSSGVKWEGRSIKRGPPAQTPGIGHGSVFLKLDSCKATPMAQDQKSWESLGRGKSQRSQRIRGRCREKKSQHFRSLGSKRDFSDELEHWNSGFLRDAARDWLEAVGFS